MKIPTPGLMGLFYGLTELLLALTRRSGRTAVSRDRQSLRLLWLVIFVSIVCGSSAPQWFPSAALPYPRILGAIGFGIFIGGLLLRWAAIWYLGKFFTVDVAVHADHRLVDRGPYRFVRHPSYTGALLAFLGLGLRFGNWWSLFFFTVPIWLIFSWRMHVEEAALREAMGATYLEYQTRTRRLVPFVY